MRAETRPDVRRRPDGSYLVDGTVPVRDLNRELDWYAAGRRCRDRGRAGDRPGRRHSGRRPALCLLRLYLRDHAPPAQPDHGAAHRAARKDGDEMAAASAPLRRRQQAQRQRMHGAVQFRGQRGMHAALAFHAAKRLQRPGSPAAHGNGFRPGCRRRGWRRAWPAWRRFRRVTSSARGAKAAASFSRMVSATRMARTSRPRAKVKRYLSLFFTASLP